MRECRGKRQGSARDCHWPAAAMDPGRTASRGKRESLNEKQEAARTRVTDRRGQLRPQTRRPAKQKLLAA
jgi:hypothetical protein